MEKVQSLLDKMEEGLTSPPDSTPSGSQFLNDYRKHVEGNLRNDVKMEESGYDPTSLPKKSHLPKSEFDPFDDDSEKLETKLDIKKEDPVKTKSDSVDPFKNEGAKKNEGSKHADGGKRLQKVRQKLPAFKMRQELTSLIESNQVTVISGETGCGKTTQVLFTSLI